MNFLLYCVYTYCIVTQKQKVFDSNGLFTNVWEQCFCFILFILFSVISVSEAKIEKYLVPVYIPLNYIPTWNIPPCYIDMRKKDWNWPCFVYERRSNALFWLSALFKYPWMIFNCWWNDCTQWLSTNGMTTSSLLSKSLECYECHFHIFHPLKWEITILGHRIAIFKSGIRYQILSRHTDQILDTRHQNRISSDKW